MRNTRKILLAVLLTSIFGCKDRDQPSETTQAKAHTASDRRGAYTVHWRESGTSEDVFSEQEFSEISKNKLPALSLVNAKLKTSTLSGELDVVQGVGALLLKAHVILTDLPIPIETAVAATGPCATPDQSRILVTNGLADVDRGLKSLFNLVDADPDRLIRALEAPEPDEQLFALKLLGIRQIKQAIPAIAKLLSDPRLPVAEEAADALARIGDEGAVPLLIKSIRRGDLRSEVRAIEAMGRIGGKEATAYLEMTAIGHEVPEVRTLSKTLLKQQQAQ